MNNKHSEAYRRISDELDRKLAAYQAKQKPKDALTEEERIQAAKGDPLMGDFPHKQDQKESQISDKENLLGSEFSVAELKRMRGLEGEEKILALKARIYNNIDKADLARNSKQLKYWTATVFELLNELKAKKSEDFQSLYSKIESAVLDPNEKPELSSDTVYGLLRNNPYARENLVSFYNKNNGINEAVKIAEKILAQHPEDAQTKAELGVFYTKLGYLVKGRKMLEEAIAANPSGTVKGASRLAALYMKEGRKAEAIKLMEKAIAAEPEDVPAKLQLVKLYAKSQRVKDAIRLSCSLAAERPEILIPQIQLAYLYWQDRQYQSAISVCEEINIRFPNNKEAKAQLGDLYERAKRGLEGFPKIAAQEKTKPRQKVVSPEGRTGASNSEETDSSLRLLETFSLEEIIHTSDFGKMKEDPEKLERWIAALFYYHNRRYEKSEDDERKINELFDKVEEVIKAGPELKVDEDLQVFHNNIFAKHLLARDYWRLRRTTDAIVLAEDNVSFAPNDQLAKIQLANFYFGTGKNRNGKKAIKLIEEIIHRFQEPELEVYEMQMNFYWHSQRGEEAIEIGKKIIQKYPDYVPIRRQLSRYLWETGKKDEAVSLAEQTNKIHPGDVAASSQLVNYYLSDAKNKEAVKILEQNVEENPTNCTALSKLANVYWILGRKEEAVATAKKMIEIEPSRAGQLADFYWNEGLKEEAINLLRESLDKDLKASPRTSLSVQLASYYWHAGHKKEALSLAEQNYENNNKNPATHIQLANLYMKNIDFASAKKIIENMNFPDDSGAQKYLWIKYYYSQIGESKQAIRKCIEYFQEGDFNSSFIRFMPIVMAYFYRIQPEHPFWDLIEQDVAKSVWIKKILSLRSSVNIKEYIHKLSSRRDFEDYIDSTELGDKFSNPQRIYKGPFLIPVNRSAKDGLTEYNFWEQGTKVLSRRPKPGKVKYINPKTHKKLSE